MSNVAGIIELLRVPDKILLSELARNILRNLSGVRVGFGKSASSAPFKAKNDILSVEFEQIIIHPIVRQVTIKQMIIHPLFRQVTIKQIIIHPIVRQVTIKQIARKTCKLMGGKGGGGGGEEAKAPARFFNAAAAVSGMAL